MTEKESLIDNMNHLEGSHRERMEYITEQVKIVSPETILEKSATHHSKNLLIIVNVNIETNIDINSQLFGFNPGCAAVIIPDNHFSFMNVANYHPNDILIIEIKESFLQHNLELKHRIWETINYLYLNPILHFNKEELQKFKLYRTIIETTILEADNLYKKTKLQTMLTAIIYEFLNKIYQANAYNANSSFLHNNENIAYRKFLELLIHDEGKHRTISYFANLLCYSPKHFCTLIHKASGKTPLKILNEHSIERIKYYLTYTDLNMTQIADTFNFSNYSFFGKFVKKYVGMCPKEYRKRTKAIPEK